MRGVVQPVRLMLPGPPRSHVLATLKDNFSERLFRVPLGSSVDEVTKSLLTLFQGSEGTKV